MITPLFQKIRTECAEVGASIQVICREAGVNRSTVERWKVKEPRWTTSADKVFAAINARRVKLQVQNVELSTRELDTKRPDFVLDGGDGPTVHGINALPEQSDPTE